MRALGPSRPHPEAEPKPRGGLARRAPTRRTQRGRQSLSGSVLGLRCPSRRRGPSRSFRRGGVRGRFGSRVPTPGDGALPEGPPLPRRGGAGRGPTRGDVADELRAARDKVEADLTARAEGVTELEALIDRTRYAAPPGLDLPRDVTLPDSVVFRDASARAVFSALGQLGTVTIVFDPTFNDTALSIDLRSTTFDVALAAVAASTQNFFRVTAPRTVTIIPDTPAKRREYEEEIVRTFYLSHADIQETIDVLRLVIDARRLAPTTSANAISIKDTPERIEAAGRLLKAIDKAPAEVVIEVQLLEVDRQALREYGLPFGDASGAGIDSTVTVGESEGGLTLNDVARLAVPDLLVANLPSLNLRLLESHTSTRVLANPRLRTSGGVEAAASFGERVPVPVTTFTPFATGGVGQQPITSFNYENVGVNIGITRGSTTTTRSRWSSSWRSATSAARDTRTSRSSVRARSRRPSASWTARRASSPD